MIIYWEARLKHTAPGRAATTQTIFWELRKGRHGVEPWKETDVDFIFISLVYLRERMSIFFIVYGWLETLGLLHLCIDSALLFLLRYDMIPWANGAKQMHLLYTNSTTLSFFSTSWFGSCLSVPRCAVRRARDADSAGPFRVGVQMVCYCKTPLLPK
jgi:hypothetical protein